MDENELNEILQEERKLLKDNRVYLVLELNEEDPTTFSMFCLDTTPDNPQKEPNVCQVIGRGLTDILSNDVEGLLDLGHQGIERDKISVGDNVINLDSYRKKKEETTQITFSFEDGDKDE
tara:strand:- start:420 stop:779 length:360 start_codon:yes stop_codon:yes gene_type:complete